MILDDERMAAVTANVMTLLDLDDGETAKVTILVEDADSEAAAYINYKAGAINYGGIDAVIRDMAIEKYNLLGNEGINSRAYGGISESYIDGYAPSIYKRLNAYRIIRTM